MQEGRLRLSRESLQPMPHAASFLARRWPLLTTVLLAVLSLAIFWPGVVSFDAVGQYGQAMTGRYDDWHPPIMARLWSLFRPEIWRAAPMLIVQVTGYWIGLGLIAEALSGWRRAAAFAIGLFPPLLGWQAVIVKDSQLMAALLLATGIIVHSRLRGRIMAQWQLALAYILIAYALLVRANALFAIVPFAVLIAARGSIRVRHGVAILAALAMALTLGPVVNHRLLGARDSGVQRTVPLYDLAGIAVRADAPLAGFAPDAGRRLKAAHCVKPLFWDTLGSRDECAAAMHPLDRAAPGHLYALLATAAIAHPFAYAAHRLAHWNSTERWLVGGRWPLAAPPARTEPNDWHLPDPSLHAAAEWMAVAVLFVGLPFCWPVVWTFAAAMGLWRCWNGKDDRDVIARALLASALAQEASFLVISISSDLRYHLWSMVATAIGWLFARRHGSKSLAAWTMAGIAFLVATGAAARWTLPPAPATYADLMR
ncbi:hypothetical protein [Sphingobium amiense]|uniref:hypothetical protein n=1 Tax=Sphingobium amiense TaxID=135719 RepID=UPI000F81E10B|nr:hypothetical protein [Sphingobium amiense]